MRQTSAVTCRSSAGRALPIELLEVEDAALNVRWSPRARFSRRLAYSHFDATLAGACPPARGSAKCIYQSNTR